MSQENNFVPPQAKYKKLRPFQIFMKNNFPFIERTYEALDYYDLLCKVVEFLNEVIKNENIVTENQEAVYNAFIELNSYVSNYFDNLDVQEEINNKLDDMVEQGIFDTIINQQIFGEMNTKINKLNIFVTIEEFKEESDVDDTNAFRLAIADGRPIYLLDEQYNISETLEITTQTQIYGKSMTNSIINMTTNDYAFSLITEVRASAYDIKTSFEFSNFTCNCKNFIKINDNTLEDGNWVKQGSLLHLLFNNLWINGKYNTLVDNNKNTNVVPDFDDMENYGIGFNLNSLFDSVISNSRIENFGIGLYLKGCDLNKINNNRLNNNGIQIYLQRVSTYGSQNLIFHNDILHNLRYGGIRIETSRFDIISKNYFEHYEASACFILANDETGLTIDNNRIDNPSVNQINIIELKPRSGDKIIDNNLNPNSNYIVYCKITGENMGSFATYKSNYLALFKNNSSGILLEPSSIFVDSGLPIEIISTFSCSNYEYVRMGGGGFVAPYYVKDDNENLSYFYNTGTASNVLIIDLKNIKRINKIYNKLRIFYKSTITQQYLNIANGSTNLYNGNVTVSDSNTYSYVDVTFNDSGNIYNELRIQLPNKNGCNIYGVQLLEA